MSFRLKIEKRAIKDVKSLPGDVQERIKDRIKSTLKENPFPDGKRDIKKIHGSDFLRLRIGDYRVFYEIDTENEIVYILSVRHRSKAYRVG